MNADGSGQKAKDAGASSNTKWWVVVGSDGMLGTLIYRCPSAFICGFDDIVAVQEDGKNPCALAIASFKI
jgi:hypothetical protein